MEATILGHHNEDPSPKVSRMWVPKFEVHEVHGNSKCREAPLRDIAANWWARLHIVLGRLHTQTHTHTHIVPVATDSYRGSCWNVPVGT
eukprot:8958960-Pyramimonas_sp.AAC.2